MSKDRSAKRPLSYYELRIAVISAVSGKSPLTASALGRMINKTHKHAKPVSDAEVTVMVDALIRNGTLERDADGKVQRK